MISCPNGALAVPKHSFSFPCILIVRSGINLAFYRLLNGTRALTNRSIIANIMLFILIPSAIAKVNAVVIKPIYLCSAHRAFVRDSPAANYTDSMSALKLNEIVSISVADWTYFPCICVSHVCVFFWKIAMLFFRLFVFFFSALLYPVLLLALRYLLQFLFDKSVMHILRPRCDFFLEYLGRLCVIQSVFGKSRIRIIYHTKFRKLRIR